MPAISHVKRNVLSSNKNLNVHIPGAFNNNVMAKSGVITLQLGMYVMNREQSLMMKEGQCQ